MNSESKKFSMVSFYLLLMCHNLKFCKVKRIPYAQSLQRKKVLIFLFENNQLINFKIDTSQRITTFTSTIILEVNSGLVL